MKIRAFNQRLGAVSIVLALGLTVSVPAVSMAADTLPVKAAEKPSASVEAKALEALIEAKIKKALADAKASGSTLSEQEIILSAIQAALIEAKIDPTSPIIPVALAAAQASLIKAGIASPQVLSGAFTSAQAAVAAAATSGPASSQPAATGPLNTALTGAAIGAPPAASGGGGVAPYRAPGT